MQTPLMLRLVSYNSLTYSDSLARPPLQGSPSEYSELDL